MQFIILLQVTDLVSMFSLDNSVILKTFSYFVTTIYSWTTGLAQSLFVLSVAKVKQLAITILYCIQYTSRYLLYL